jgi:transmembrane sensor
MPESVREQAVAWLLRFRSDTFSDKDREDFNRWLAENPLHPKAFRTLTEQWQWLNQFKTVSFPARKAALNYRKCLSHTPLWRYAAAAAVLLSSLYAAFSADGWMGLPYTYATAKGERQTIMLADGSRVELNTGTEVRVHYNHRRRYVELLRGEAFFTVQHNAERPFEVAAGHGVIRDLGTEFNVYRRTDRVEVAVQEGRVAVDSRGERRELSAGQQIAYHDDGHFTAAVRQSMVSATAWRKGLLLFQGIRLDEALTEIGRYHDTAIGLPNEDLAKMRVNGTFRTGELDAMLNAVGALLPVKARRVGPREIVLEAVR